MYSEFQHDGVWTRLVGPRRGNWYSDACTCIVSGVFDTHSLLSRLGAAYYLDLSDEYLLIDYYVPGGGHRARAIVDPNETDSARKVRAL